MFICADDLIYGNIIVLVLIYAYRQPLREVLWKTKIKSWQAEAKPIFIVLIDAYQWPLCEVLWIEKIKERPAKAEHKQFWLN